MKTNLLAASLLLVLALASCVRADDDLKEFKSDSGGFSMLLPSEAKEVIHEIPGTGQKLHAFLVEKEGEVYGVMYNDLPLKPDTADKVDAMFDAGRDSILGRVNGKLRKEKKITLGGNPGREVLVDSPDGLVFWWRLYLVKNRLYQVTSIVKKANENDPQVAKMLDSFKPIEK